MHLLLDKLSATIIAMVIAAMIFEINLQNEGKLAETSAFLALTTHTEAFAKIMRRDLQGIESVLTTEEEPVAGGYEFRFVSRVGQDTTQRTIVYRRELAFERHGLTFYRVKRFVDGDEEGGSHDIITDWKIEALNEDAGAITDPNNMAQVHVLFNSASPVLDTDIVRSMRWESRFFPPLRND